ncbi:MAG: DUF2203 domain-containing protein [Pyrinomonadaceae bacterium]
MKLFTIEEANSILPDVGVKLRKIQRLYSMVGVLKEPAQKAAAASNFGGGMEGGSEYVRSLYEIGKITTELNADGIQLKDYSNGLIDFPSMRDGRIVLLCWKLGEPEFIEWWHEVETGFAGRQPL